MASRQEIVLEQQAAFRKTHNPHSALLVEAWSSNQNIQKRWDRCGFIALLPMNCNGLFYAPNGLPLGYSFLVKDSPYDIAMKNIRQSIIENQEEPSTAERALNYMQQACLEESELHYYLPGQEDV